MAEKITVYQCPACTGPLHFDAKSGKLRCDYCGGEYTVEEARAHYEAKNKDAAAADHAAAEKAAQKEAEEAKAREESGQGPEMPSDWGSEAAHMRAYSCSSCGAELICDDSTAATSCPYCGNPTIMPGKFDGKNRPDYVIPFKVEKKEAVEALKGYYKGRFLLPGTFAAQNHIEEITGVYVPFWMFSGQVESKLDYDARKVTKEKSGDTEITTTEYYDVHREGVMRFSQIPVDASTKMPDDLMDSIEPYDYKQLKPFAMEYMPGYLANKYDVPVEECQKRADERAVSSTHEAIRQTVKNYTSANIRTKQDKVTCEKVEYGMLPVWLLNTKWDGKDFLFAMNGQSGKMIGDLPVSTPRLVGITAAIFAVIFGLLHFVILTGGNDSTLVSIIAGAIVAGIAALVMKGSMKPVQRSHSAKAYVSKEWGFKILAQNDRFVKREQKKEQKKEQAKKA
ncbi:MAG: hypothetical protein IJG52_00800 [Lachnospiraceae bacterium]|nr:hypothetical protein [Lachnospiraceae bacterium]